MKRFNYIILIIFLLIICSNIKAVAKTCTFNVDDTANYTYNVELDGVNYIEENKSKSIKVTAIYNDISEIRSTYSSEDNNIAIVDSTGRVTGVKKGTTKITVTTAFGDLGTCSEIINVGIIERIKSNDSTLKTLSVKNYLLTPTFKSAEFNYSIITASNEKEIEIIAESNDPNATISGDGKKEIKNKETEFTIIVTAEDGSTSSYKLKVNREDANTYLRTLDVSNYQLNEKFDKKNYEYTLDIDSETTFITITAEAEDNTSVVTIKGDKKLQGGKNEVAITVTAPTKEETVYKIIVNKEEALTTITTKSDTNPSTLRKTLFIVGIILSLALVILGIYFLIKELKKKRIKTQKEQNLNETKVYNKKK